MVSHVTRRKFLGVAAAASAATVLAACQPEVVEVEKEVTRVVEQEVTKEVEKIVKETVVVTETVAAQPSYEQGNLTVLFCCSGPEEFEAKDAYNQEFVASHPGLTVELQQLPAGQNYFEKLMTTMAAGTAPDVFDMWEGYVQPYAENGQLVNLDPFLETDSKVNKDSFQPAAEAAATYQDSFYAFMMDFIPGPVELFFNTAHFDAAGLPYPTELWTWDNVREAASALTIGTSGSVPDQWGLVYDNWFVMWLYQIWSNGADVFNADETMCTISDPKAVEALQYWADLVVKDQVAISGAELSTLGGSTNAFAAGAVSMLLGNSWDVGTIKAAEGLEWKGVIAPLANNGKRVWYTHTLCYSISTQSKMPNAAWEWIRDMVFELIPEKQQYAPAIPALKEQLYVFATTENADLGWDKLLTLVSDPTLMRIPGSGSKWDKIAGMIQAELDLVWIGEKTAEEAAATVTPDVDAELAREG
ncbi:MAG: ABC transporter substrate-binding protein [Anaerolineae bacterium]